MQVDFCTNLYNPPAPSLFSAALNAPTLPLWELQTSPTDDLVLLAVTANFYNNGVGAQNFTLGLGRPLVVGVGASIASSMAENAMDTGTVPATKLLTTWSRLPTIPTNYLRRAQTSVLTSAGGHRFPRINFLFPSGLRVPPSSSVALWSLGGSATQYALDFSIIVDD